MLHDLQEIVDEYLINGSAYESGLSGIYRIDLYEDHDYYYGLFNNKHFYLLAHLLKDEMHVGYELLFTKLYNEFNEYMANPMNEKTSVEYAYSTARSLKFKWYIIQRTAVIFKNASNDRAEKE